MLYDGVKLVEGSNIQNLVVDVGTQFPQNPEVGELFYRSDSGNQGLYAFNGSAWTLMGGGGAALGYTPVNRAGDTMTGALTLSGAPTSALHAASKNYVDDAISSAISGLPSGGGSGSTATSIIVVDDIIVDPIPGLGGRGGPQTISGVHPTDGGQSQAGQRILVASQINARLNGIYVASDTNTWVRASDWAPGATVEQGTAVFNNGWGPSRAVMFIVTMQSAATSGVVGTDAINFIPLGAAGAGSWQPSNPDLTALASLSGSGYAHRTGAGVWELSEPAGSSAPTTHKNYIVNGDFSVWQTGKGFLLERSLYQHTADRWKFSLDGDAGRSDLFPVILCEQIAPADYPEFSQGSQLSNVGPTVDSFNALRFLQTSALQQSTVRRMSTRIEGVTRLQSCSATLSFWARVGAAAGGAAVNVTPRLTQNFGSYTSVASLAGNSSVTMILPRARPSTSVTVPVDPATIPSLPAAVPPPAQQVYPGPGAPTGHESDMQLVIDTSLAGINGLSQHIEVTATQAGHVSVDIDWGDGSAPTAARTAGVYEHTYASHGIYTIKIAAAGSSPAAGSVIAGSNIGVSCLTEVISFGSGLGLSSMYLSFVNCHNLIRVPAWLPPTVTTTSRMFFGCNMLNDPNISYWDTSAVINMRGMFRGCTGFNQPLGGWNVSAVQDMSEMFAGARAFNQPVGHWNVGAVTQMSYMFHNAHRFNQDLSSWSVQNSLNGHSNFDLGALSWTRAWSRPNWAPSSQPDVTVEGQPISINSSYWRKYSVTMSLPPATVGNLINALHNGDDFLEVKLDLDGGQPADLYFAAVQLVAGTDAGAAERRSFDEQHAACQRYRQLSYQYGTAPGSHTAAGAVTFLQPTGAVVNTVSFGCDMRDRPTITFYNPVDSANPSVSNPGPSFGNSWIQGTAPAPTFTAIEPVIINAGSRSFSVLTTGSAAASTAGSIVTGHWLAEDPKI